MDTMTVTFALILLAVGVLLIIEVRPYYSRQNYSGKTSDEEFDRVAHREQLKELHRMRRQRDRIWFRMDNLYDEFVKKTSIENPKTEAPPHTSDGQGDNWNNINLAYLKEKYESFLSKD
jgi:hypothetical protein